MRGVAYLVTLTVTIAACFFILLPSVLLLPLSNIHIIMTLRNQYHVLINEAYFQLAAAWIYYIFGIKVILHTEDVDVLRDPSCFVICNHRCTVDMMFSGWCYATFLSTYPLFTFFLKDSLKSVPFFSYCMQMLLFVFLSRRKEEDLPHIRNLFRHYAKYPCVQRSFIMFPEGSDLSKSNIEKNNTYARNNGLRELQQVMYPRPAGFITCINLLKEQMEHGNSMVRGMAVHDMTIAYKDRVRGKRTVHTSILKDEFPSEVHLYVKKHSLLSFPDEPDQLEQWLIERFYEKEELLTKCYVNNQYDHSKEFPVTLVSSSQWKSSGRTLCYSFLMLLLVYLVAYTMIANSFLRAVMIVYLVCFALLSSLFGGMDRLIVRCF